MGLDVKGVRRQSGGADAQVGADMVPDGRGEAEGAVEKFGYGWPGQVVNGRP